MGNGCLARRNAHCIGLVVALVVVFSARTSAVESNAASTDQLSMEFGFLEQASTVTTKSKSRKQPDAPGVVTVLTREDIERTGARDLIDVLNLVPGFAFGTDIFSSVFNGFRGLWAPDGKVLLLWNGHEMQELMYTETFLANRFPIDQIERIEIIRGPGSLVYGGAAEFAVVNIVTHAPADLDGMRFSGTYSQRFDGIIKDNQSIENTFGQRTISVEYGQVLRQLDNLSLHAGLFAGQGFLSDRRYTDFAGNSYSMAGSSRMNPLLLDLSAEYRDVKLRYLFEDYYLTNRDGYTDIFPSPVSSSFLMSSLYLGYDWHISNGLKVIPFGRHVWQKPWMTTGNNARELENVYWKPLVQRLQAGVSVVWDPLENLNLLAGVEYTHDWAEDTVYGFNNPDNPDELKSKVGYHNVATYLRGLLDTTYINMMVAARFEYHNMAGTALVTQVALTKTFGRFYFKALFAEAFRAPSIMNSGLSYETTINPEKTSDYEVEIGWQVCDFLWVAANGFSLTVERPIVYYYDTETMLEGYRNYGETGSRGFELQVRFRYKRFYSWLTYSFYDATKKNTVETFQAPGKRHVLLGFAPHKLTFSGGIEIVRDLSFNISGSLLSNQRFGYASTDVEGNALVKEYSPELLINAYLLYKDVGVRGLSIGLGVYNVLDVTTRYIQAYNNGHAPLPGPSLEVLLKIGYELSFGSCI